MGDVRESTNRQAVVVGLLLVLVTLAGVSACSNAFSFLMVVCLGAPGLLLALDALLAPS
jgi:hypothetical protein